MTLAHRRGEVEHLVPSGIPVVGMSFIPAEETRAQRAMVDPMARVGIVSIFPEFTALMKPGVLRFAPHVSDVDVRLITAPDLAAFLSQVDVAIYASGAEDRQKTFAARSAGHGIPLRAGPTCDPRHPAPGYRAAALVHRFARGNDFMKISEMNWLQVEEYLKSDDRAVVPLGCTEQHAYLSLSVDSILAERVASDAAAPAGVPVFPVQAYGITPYFMAYPGTISLSADTYLRIITDILDSLETHGLPPYLFVNGHGGNTPGQTAAIEWMGRNPECRVKFHNWWNAPRTFEKVKEIDPVASHASWMENFPGPVCPEFEQPSHQADGRSGAHADIRPRRRSRDPAGGQFRRLFPACPTKT